MCGVVWGLENPDVVVPCKNAHGARVMAWVGIVDGQVLPVHWSYVSRNAPDQGVAGHQE